MNRTEFFLGPETKSAIQEDDMKPARQHETKSAIQETTAPSNETRELLAQAVEMVSAIHHQNDHTREWVARAKAVLEPETAAKSDEGNES
jgi:hypothetical protein